MPPWDACRRSTVLRLIATQRQVNAHQSDQAQCPLVDERRWSGGFHHDLQFSLLVMLEVVRLFHFYFWYFRKQAHQWWKDGRPLLRLVVSISDGYHLFLGEIPRQKYRPIPWLSAGHPSAWNWAQVFLSSSEVCKSFAAFLCNQGFQSSSNQGSLFINSSQFGCLFYKSVINV